jgi:hypothetical protein
MVDAPIPTQASPVNIQIFLISGFPLSFDNGKTVNANARRIVNAFKAYGNPTWVDAGNWRADRAHWLTPHLTSAVIKYFHANGIKVACRIPSEWGNLAYSHVKAMVDFQLKIGPEIDAFDFDNQYSFYRVSAIGNTAKWKWYKSLYDYVHSKGKQVFANCGTVNFSEDLFKIVDCLGVEHDWFYMKQRYPSLLKKGYKFYGVINNEGPEGAATPTVAIAKTLQARNEGFYYFDARISYYSLPSWWEQYLKAIRR